MMRGWPLPHDRLYEMDTGDFVGQIREYNDELTGFDARFESIDPDVFRYGGNAYYIVGDYARRKGWAVREVKDRGE